MFVLLPAFLVFVCVDVLFISMVAAPLFAQALGALMRPTPDITSGLLAWVVIVGTVYTYAVPRFGSSVSEAGMNVGTRRGRAARV